MTDIKYTQETIALAKKNAREMLLTHENEREVTFAQGRGVFFVSFDKNSLLDPGVGDIDGINFYYSILKA